MLPSAWVDALFAKLTIRYGVAFTRQWPDTPIELVKADWAEVLDGYSAEAIKYALEYLPIDKPPTALQFRALCNNRPAPELLALPNNGIRPDPERVRELLERIGTLSKGNHPHAWAMKLKKRQVEGHTLSAAQRDALARFDANTQTMSVGDAMGGNFKPIPREMWPWVQKEAA